MFKNDDTDKPNLRSSRGRGRGRGRGGRTRNSQSKSKEQVVYVRPSALRTLEYLQPYNSANEVVNGDQLSESEAEDWQGESR